MKKYNLILTASLITSLSVSTVAFAKAEPKKPEPPRAVEQVKMPEKAKAPAVRAPEKQPAKVTVKEKVPAKPAPAKPEPKGAVSPKPVPQKKAPVPVRKGAHSSRESDIITIAAALLRLSS